MPGLEAISDLDKNRVLEQWLEWQLRQVRTRIRSLESQEAERLRQAEQVHAEPSWKVHPKRGDAPPVLHRGDCAVYPRPGQRLNRTEARLATREPYMVMCEICTPEADFTDE
ncbi:DUF6233 domain-containing protein [Streptomyces sp. NPDC015032]|uniref:DUF6233 domain-containing protein n=1 Tax=Streptomyces sp. NPDC015032 TaxID=3364937 RepID=UPI0036FB8EF6